MRAAPVVGVMVAGREETVAAFKAGMRENGFADGESVTFHVRVAHGDAGKLPEFARELVGLKVDLIAAVGAVTARAARAASDAIPVVYAVVVDPPGDGLATASGGPLPNMTGITTFDAGQAQEQIRLLQSIVPNLARVACLADAAVSDCLPRVNEQAAHQAGLAIGIVPLAGPAPDLQTAFDIIRDQRAQALIVLEHPALSVHAASIAQHALAQNLVTLFPLEQAGLGGLLSYGTAFSQAAHAMARPASRILRGEAASDLPIVALRRPSLVADLRTADRLGLRLPPALLLKADRLIE